MKSLPDFFEFLRSKIATEGRAPDYSIDRWINMAKDMGGNVNTLVGHGEEEAEKLDKEKEKKEKEKAKIEKDDKAKTPPKPPAKSKTPDKPEESEERTPEQETAWQSLMKIHREKSQQSQKDKKPQPNKTNSHSKS